MVASYTASPEKYLFPRPRFVDAREKFLRPMNLKQLAWLSPLDVRLNESVLGKRRLNGIDSSSGPYFGVSAFLVGLQMD